MVFADKVSADTFSFTSSNYYGKASNDISLSSDYLKPNQPEVAIPIIAIYIYHFVLKHNYFHLVTCLLMSIMRISTVVGAIKFVFIVLKIIILFCVCWCFASAAAVFVTYFSIIILL